ncbi:MAG: hypothetical protein IPN27_00025 [Cellvibrionales bacterium]|jgi:hypothetical protein|nr:hypothetical protein [Cellvibrionales bacterium]MBK8674809.1 hypothetical protein [Cellvibrionales bacterium]
MSFRKITAIFVTWLIWLPVSIAISFKLFGWGGQCAVDNCGTNEPWWNNLLFVVWVFGVPVLYTIFLVTRSRQAGRENGS